MRTDAIATTVTASCWFCQQQLPLTQMRYIARYDMDICHTCYTAWN